MRIKYFDDLKELLHDEYDVSIVPRVGDMVWFDEIYFVNDVVWYPKNKEIHVYASESPPKQKVKVAEHAGSNVHLREVRQARDVADKALKESTELKRQVFSIRQYINNQVRNATKDDSR